MTESAGAFGSWFDGKEAGKGITVFPPQLLELQGPVVFLAGPIKGSARWQDEAISYLEHTAPWLNVASPRRSLDRAADYTEHDYISQVDWESHYLRVAARQGVIFFFFAKEVTHFCDRPFARTTRIEYGEWMAHHELRGTPLVVGFEEGFDGDKYIRHRLQTLPGVPIGENLIEALDEVIAQAKSQIVPNEVPCDWTCYSWSRELRMRCGSQRCPLKGRCTNEQPEMVVGKAYDCQLCHRRHPAGPCDNFPGFPLIGDPSINRCPANGDLLDPTDPDDVA